MLRGARGTAVKLASQLAAKIQLSKQVERWNARRGGVILAFHEISSARLAAHLEQLAEGYDFISLTGFVNRLKAGKSTVGTCAITFDDGYQGTVEAAAKLAAERKIPMTFYLPTRYMEADEPFWYQELKPLIERAVNKKIVVREMALSLDGKANTAASLKTLDASFRRLSSISEIEKLLRETRAAVLDCEERPADLSSSNLIPPNRVRELAAREELGFEAHTINHFALSRLTKEAIRGEMEQSRERIEELTNRSVRHFCYPFGGAAEIGEVAPEVARTIFESATTMLRGRCGAKVDLMRLPRVPLYESDTDEAVRLKVGFAR